jgi:hypothetical protein
MQRLHVLARGWAPVQPLLPAHQLVRQQVVRHHPKRHATAAAAATAGGSNRRARAPAAAHRMPVAAKVD